MKSLIAVLSLIGCWKASGELHSCMQRQTELCKAFIAVLFSLSVDKTAVITAGSKSHFSAIGAFGSLGVDKPWSNTVVFA